jgi:glutamine cyclotransferase
MSDGTSYLRFLDPSNFKVMRRLQVIDDSGHPIDNLNELEFIRGEIYANVWHSDDVLRISPETGEVLGVIDLRGIIDKRELQGGDAVLNGIAYDAPNNRLFVTGKLWPSLFEIRTLPR